MNILYIDSHFLFCKNNKQKFSKGDLIYVEI